MLFKFGVVRRKRDEMLEWRNCVRFQYGRPIRSIRGCDAHLASTAPASIRAYAIVPSQNVQMIDHDGGRDNCKRLVYHWLSSRPDSVGLYWLRWFRTNSR